MPSYQRVVYTALRVIAPFIIMQHGAQKLLGLLGGVGLHHGSAPLLSLMGLAGIIEFVVASLVLVGLFTRPAAFIVSGEMAAAYVKVHAPRGFWPIQNHGELAVVLCFTFLFFAAFGGGRYSLDTLFFGAKAERSAEALRLV
ncbi:MAG TPA: DoxX family protein [Gemmatimonadaceae bacterium]|nr:DoxX family protein [Gemmatimonadaceae bacterium]